MTEYFDELDTLAGATRERNLFRDLPQELATAVRTCSGLARHLDGCDISRITSRDALTELPVLRKSDLIAAQQADPPFGGFVDVDALAGSRVFMSPGPVWEPQVSGADPWLAARALYAAGVRRGDRIHNAFSYHLTPGGFILDEGARALGCIVFPAGVGSTDAQVTALQQLGSSVYIGTPDYLQTLLNYAAESTIALPQLKRALVSGGALFPSMRDSYRESGIHVQQCYATADLGVIAYESATGDTIHAGMLVNEGMLVEIVKPGTGEPVTAGEVGEVLVTRMHSDYPLLRFATGDMSAFLDEASPCGRTAARIKGWMGRADQRTKVRGMFVDPAQVQAVRQAHAEIARLRLVVSRQDDKDVMLLRVATHASDDASDDALPLPTPATIAIADTLQRITGLTARVELSPDGLPNDGVVIEDQRDYEQ